MADKEKGLVRNELLCFMQQKSAVLKFDDLVSIVVGYYSNDEIKGAVTIASTTMLTPGFLRIKALIRIESRCRKC